MGSNSVGRELPFRDRKKIILLYEKVYKLKGKEIKERERVEIEITNYGKPIKLRCYFKMKMRNYVKFILKRIDNIVQFEQSLHGRFCFTFNK